MTFRNSKITDISSTFEHLGFHIDYRWAPFINSWMNILVEFKGDASSAEFQYLRDVWYLHGGKKFQDTARSRMLVWIKCFISCFFPGIYKNERFRFVI